MWSRLGFLVGVTAAIETTAFDGDERLPLNDPQLRPALLRRRIH